MGPKSGKAPIKAKPTPKVVKSSNAKRTGSKPIIKPIKKKASVILSNKNVQLTKNSSNNNNKPKLILQDPNLIKSKINMFKNLKTNTNVSVTKTINNSNNKGNQPIKKDNIIKNQQQQKQVDTYNTKKNITNITMAIQTAKAISSNLHHPKQSEVNQLLITLEKGWIDNNKFINLLQSMLF